MRSESHKLLDTVVLYLRNAARVTVLTGAGISAESGVSTFRGSGGLWRDSRPEDLATTHAFMNDSLRVWQWYEYRRELISQAKPNAGHRVLAKWKTTFQTFSLITQNVDGLHERAGSRDLIPLHGSIWKVRCLNNCIKSPASWTDKSVPFNRLPPLCPDCGSIVRPDVVWFGESLDYKNIEAAFEASRCDVFLSIGTSALVRPASEFVKYAKSNGSFTVELNLERTTISDYVDISVHDKAHTSLCYLDEGLMRK